MRREKVDCQLAVGLELGEAAFVSELKWMRPPGSEIVKQARRFARRLEAAGPWNLQKAPLQIQRVFEQLQILGARNFDRAEL